MTTTLPTTMDKATLATLRAEFPILREYTYVNAAEQGPMPDRTARAAEAAIRLSQLPRSKEAAAAPSPDIAAAAGLARLIGADAGDITWTSNTTHGTNICAQGIEWREGDNVVIPANEHPSVGYSWYNLTQRGVEVRVVPFNGPGPSAATLLDAVDSHTRAVGFSAITWNTGWRADLELLGAECARLGVLLVVDGIQAVGARQLDVKALRISALSMHAFKWLVSGHGVGALYVAPEALDRIRPTFIGSQAVESASGGFEQHLTWKPGAARYGAGGLNQIGLSSLVASIGLIEEIGLGTIESHNQALSDQLYVGLQQKTGVQIVSSTDPSHRSAIVVFTLGSTGRNAVVVKELEAQGIIVALRPLGIRVSPHFYNSEDDVARLLAAVK